MHSPSVASNVPPSGARSKVESSAPPSSRHFDRVSLDFLSKARDGTDKALKYLKEEGFGDLHKPGSRMLVYEALSSLLQKTLESSGWVRKETVEEWNGVLGALLQISRGNVQEVTGLEALQRAFSDAELTPQQLTKLGAVFRRIDGGLRHITSPRRHLAFSILNEIEGKLLTPASTPEQELSLRELHAPASPRSSLEELGRILVNRWSAGNQEGISFIKRELTGPGINMNDYDREAVLYFAFKRLSAWTIETYETGSGEAIVQRSREWNAAFKTVEEYCRKGKKGVVNNLASPLKRGLLATSEEYGERTSALIRCWEILLDERYAKLGKEMLGLTAIIEPVPQSRRKSKKAA